MGTTKVKSKTTKDHKVIQKWVEERNGKPAIVRGTEGNQKGVGLLRFKFSEESSDNLKEISWDEFFKTFDEKNLEFLYQEETADGGTSRFFKFVEDK